MIGGGPSPDSIKDYGATLTERFGIANTLYSADEFRDAGHDSTEQFGAR